MLTRGKNEGTNSNRTEIVHEICRRWMGGSCLEHLAVNPDDPDAQYVFSLFLKKVVTHTHTLSLSLTSIFFPFFFTVDRVTFVTHTHTLSLSLSLSLSLTSILPFFLFLQIFKRYSSILRDDGYKLIVGQSGRPGYKPGDYRPRLFHVYTDLAETHDLADTARGRPIVQEMLGRLDELSRTASVAHDRDPIDPRSDPRLHGGVWVPWLD